MSDTRDIRSVALRLTPAAREALEEVVGAYRERLLEQVELDHPDGDITGIDLLRSVYAEPSPADAARLAAELANIDGAIVYREYVQRRATAFGILLVSAAIAFAAAAAILPMLFPAFGVFNLAIVGVALAGSVALITFAVLNNLRAERSVRMAREERRLVEYQGLTRQLPPSDRVGTKDGSSSFGAAAEFLDGWNEIERLLMRLAEYTLDTLPGKRLSFSTALKQVNYLNILTDYEVQQVRDLLTIRNDLVHGELPRNYDLDSTRPQVMQAVQALQSQIDRVEPGARIKRGKRFVETFLESDAARRPLPHLETDETDEDRQAEVERKPDAPPPPI